MNKTEINNLKINDTIYFVFSVFDCVASGCVTAVFTDSVYVEIRYLIYDDKTERYNGHMTIGVNVENAFMTKEEAIEKRCCR